MLRRLGGVRRVGTLDFNNPFPFALLWPPPRGDFWAWHNENSFSASVHPTPADAFGDAEVMMVPKFAGHADSCRMLKILYGGYIQQQFTLTMESDQWLLYSRK